MSSYLGFLVLLSLFSNALAGPCETCTSVQGLLNTNCWNADTNECVKGLLGICPAKTTIHPYNCPVDPPAAFEYTDAFGRGKVLPFLAANTGNTTEQIQTCFNNRASTIPGVTLLSKIDAANCSGYVALNPLDQAIVVSFRGAIGLDQFLTVGLNVLLGPQISFPTGGTVFVYYANCFNQLLTNGLGAQVIAAKTAHPTFELWSFGHSLGGSLASLNSAYWVSIGLFTSDKVKQVTTGATRTGNLDFAAGHDALVPNAYRIVNYKDWITKLPPKLNIDDASSFHHRHEVWYPVSMDPTNSQFGFTIYKQAEDFNGSASQGIDLTDTGSHNSYFIPGIDTWVNTGCVD